MPWLAFDGMLDPRSAPLFVHARREVACCGSLPIGAEGDACFGDSVPGSSGARCADCRACDSEASISEYATSVRERRDATLWRMMMIMMGGLGLRAGLREGGEDGDWGRWYRGCSCDSSVSAGIYVFFFLHLFSPISRHGSIFPFGHPPKHPPSIRASNHPVAWRS